MARASFLATSTIALTVLLRGTQPLDAGTITFGGDLAAALGGPISTPTTLDAGATPTFHFDSGDVADVGRVSGDVALANSADATAGSITVTNFQFVSEKPLGSGPVGFTIDVSQDFAYAGPPQVAGSEALGGLYTFTAAPQSGLVSLAVAVNSFVLPSLVVPGLSTGPPFPRGVPISPSSPPGQVVGVLRPMHMDLILGVSLSDNALGAGPRADLTSAVVRYVAVPEPSTLLMSSIAAALAGLGYRWRRGLGQLVSVYVKSI